MSVNNDDDLPDLIDPSDDSDLEDSNINKRNKINKYNNFNNYNKNRKRQKGNKKKYYIQQVTCKFVYIYAMIDIVLNRLRFLHKNSQNSVCRTAARQTKHSELYHNQILK